MQFQLLNKIADPITYTALRGRSLLAVRILCGVGVLLALGVFLTSLPVSIHTALTTSSSGQLGGGKLGLSGPAIAIFRAVVDCVTVLVFLASAILITVRRSNSWVILLLSLTLILAGVNYTDAFFALYSRTWPLTPLTALVGFTSALAEICQLAAFLIFPDGRFTPRWLGWLLVMWIPYRLLGWLVAYPIGLSVSLRLVDLLTQLTFFGMAIAGQVYRYHQADSPVRRLQTKWIVFGLSVAVIALILYVGTGIVVPALNIPDTTTRLVYVVAGTVSSRIALLLVPLSMVISILRFRLWDIDLLINRSLVYGTLAVLVIALFAGSTLLLERIFTSLTGEQSAMIAIAVSGAVFGALFQPVHRRLQSFVDRRFYGIFIDYRKNRQITPPVPLLDRQTGIEIDGYEVLEPLGWGGMSVVYKGRQISLGRLVAIKVLLASLARQPNFRHRFEREARVVASLRHPNIVQLFDYGESSDVYYMVMEYLGGQTLGDHLRAGGAMPIPQAREIIAELSEALDYAHLQGIIHRDIKPSNIMLVPVTAGGGSARRAVLMDFGIARMAGGITNITSTGLVGTFDYISPEQIRDAKDVDGRADIYSLGVMAFQMLTGKLPFSASNPSAVLIAHMQQPAPDPRSLCPDLPDNVAAAILKALEKDPAKRFDTAGAMAGAIV